jgi:cytoskeletal protein CcmA (bactofilin family)
MSGLVRVVGIGVLLLAAIAVVPGVAAAEDRAEGTIIVEDNETIDGDLDAFGGTVVVRGTVDGDLSAFAGTVQVDGRVTGDVSAFAGNVVLGPNGTVDGNFSAATGSVIIAGTVGGDVEAATEEVSLADTAVVFGDVTYDGTLDRAAGATVAGTVSEGDVSVSPFGDADSPVPPWVFDVYGFLTNLALGAVLLLAIPAFSNRTVRQALDDPVRTGGIGLLALVAVPVALALLAVTIVGLPLSLFGLVAYVLALWIGAVYGRLVVGTWLLDQVDVDNRWIALLVGLVLVGLVTRVPWVGGLVELVVLLLGFGALASLLTVGYRRRRDTGEDEGSEPAGAEDAASP